MPVTRPDPVLSLAAFLTELRGRLDALSDGELEAVLIGHAERLPPVSRHAFLEIFPAPSRHPADSIHPPAAESLRADIETFAARVAAGDFDDGHDAWDDGGWHGERHRGQYWGAEEPAPAWVAEADDLIARVGELFVTGRLEQAREGYARLLNLFAPADDDIALLEIWELDGTDVGETLARYLRTAYETTDPTIRAGTLHGAWMGLPWSPTPLTLRQIATTRPVPLPELAAFLPDWIDCLLGETAWPRSNDRVRLLAEAADLLDGPDTLADLARRPGPHQSGISLAWIDALIGTDRLHDAAAAARHTLDLPDIDAGHRGSVADRLADLAVRLSDQAGAVQARQTAWRHWPTRARLLALVTDSQTAGILAQIMDTEADALPSHDRLGCELLLLAGRVDQAVAALTCADPLGWSRPTHPGPVVLPYLWTAATGTPPTGGHLGQAFTAIDHLPGTTPFDLALLADNYFHDQDDAGDRPTDNRDDLRGELSLTRLLTEAITRRRARQADRDRWLTTARAVVDARIDAIVTNKHRGAYARAASLTFAHAEALTARGRAADGLDYLADIRSRYPRHVAFRGELEHAARTSTLTAPRSAGSRGAPRRR